MQQLFLQQSYQDCWETYEKSLRNGSCILWDYVILTASNEAQAESYRTQIEYRNKAGYLPESTKYVVLSDPDGKRVGSGGATLNVLRYLAEDGCGSFSGKRILVIHSGGDSKRIPQYSICGKIFSPVPRELPDGRNSTLFDEFMISMAGVAGRLKEGMLVLSGDVLLLFNPLQIDFTFSGAAALSIKEPVRLGTRHGVFLNDGADYVGRFLHKQPEEVLAEYGAVNDRGCVDLDTGAVALDVKLMEALYGLISTDGRTDAEKFARFVNEKARVSFYGDFLYPLAKEADREAYMKEAGEGPVCEELLCCRRAIWDAISGFSMRLISLTPAEFIHFGTTKELLELVTKGVEEYAFLGWKKLVGTGVVQGGLAVYNSIIGQGIFADETVYIENSVLKSGMRIGRGSVISNIRYGGEEKLVIPAGVVLTGARLLDGRFTVRIYGVEDNPKDRIGEIMSGNILALLGEDITLWDAPVYPICAERDEAVTAALITYRMMKGIASVEEKEWWLAQEKISLSQSFSQADVRYAVTGVLELAEQIAVYRAILLLAQHLPWQAAMEVFGKHGMNGEQEKQMLAMAETADFGTSVRIYNALAGEARRRGQSYEKYEKMCFAAIRRAVYENNGMYCHEALQFKKDEAHVELPVRVNWAGGWTDTPPHCLEKGGTVVNAAIKLNGVFPIQVTVRRIEALKIEVASEDIGAFGELCSLEEIYDCSNPYDAFALHKAALLACGVVPEILPEGESLTLQDILQKMGGGLFLSTQVVGIPKGSGLGTSSILAAACAKALYEIMGVSVADEVLYKLVLYMEQLMSTGGGWQDQVGGLSGGIKFITTTPGLVQDIRVHKVEISEAAAAELQERFALIYTGQRRLARNLLRDVMSSYIGGRRETVEALYFMHKMAALMRFELERGDIDEVAKLFNQHWELSKQLDSGCTNTCIEQIFRACEDLIAGRFIAGAGGGGFLQVILKKNVTKQQLRERLKEVFQDSGVDVWDSEFV
ncbi:MAG: bifunctional fucokinase/L-fucose-1-P-guanylyltransferase [Lachnospiraceae bacterium]|nr:bifunctional fucokinase/L-fucose-1-P-guanylyltransferase [Lachnospiraceae bacterium]